MTPFVTPHWVPQVEPGQRTLIIGASGGLGHAVINMLLQGPDSVIGAHGATKLSESNDARVVPLTQKFSCEADCRGVVDSFVEKVGGIDALIILSGGIHFSGHWKDMPESKWEEDIAVNMNQPFYLARAAMEHMKQQERGGRIVFNGTESAIHGGSALSFPYAIAKRGTECMVQGLAREGASHGILVNGIRMGYVKSGFHQRWHNKTPTDMDERAELVPLKRGGEPEEAAALIIYLISGWSQFITGQMLPLTGGDWL